PALHSFPTRRSSDLVTPLNTVFSGAGLSQVLLKVAELISVRDFLGTSRQIYFVNYGGWDHHDNLLNNMNTMLPIVSNALHEFNQDRKSTRLNSSHVK